MYSDCLANASNIDLDYQANIRFNNWVLKNKNRAVLQKKRK